jgi:acetate kinase
MAGADVWEPEELLPIMIDNSTVRTNRLLTYDSASHRITKWRYRSVRTGVSYTYDDRVFDTVFHQTIPQDAALYPLPLDLAQRHRIRRYGFHGISHRYMMMQYAQITRRLTSELNLITLHLKAALLQQLFSMASRSISQWAFTPLEGLMMAKDTADY